MGMPTQFAGSNFSGYLSGRMPTQQYSTTPSLTNEQMNAISMNTFNRIHGSNVGVSPWEHIARFSTGTAIDLADSVLSSPIVPGGFERGDLWAMTSPEQQNYYQNNKGLIEGTSAIVGGLGTAIAAEALLIPRLASGLATSTAITGSRLWRATASWNESARAGMLMAQKAAAESGEAFSLMGSSAGRQFMANRVAAGVATTTRTLPLEYSLFWNNDAFNSGDFAQEGFWVGAAATLGGTIGAVGGRALARRTANSPEIRDLRHNAIATAGIQNDLLSTDFLERSARIDTNRDAVKQSAWFTEMMHASRDMTPNQFDASPKNTGRSDSLRGSYLKEAIDSMQIMVNDGIDGVKTIKGGISESKGPIKFIPEIAHAVNVTAKNDPFLFHGAAGIGIPTNSFKEMKVEREAYIELLRKQSQTANMRGNEKEARRLAVLQRALSQQEDFALVNGSWMRTDSELATAAQAHSLEKAKAAVKPVKGTEGVKVKTPISGDLYLDAGLFPTDKAGKEVSVTSIPLKDRFYLAEAANKVVANMSRKDVKVQFQLTKKSAKNWFTLDVAAEILDKGGKIGFEQAATGLRSLEEVKRESLRLKAQALLGEIGSQGRITPELRFKYNLPQATPMEMIEDSAGDGFRAWLHEAAGPKRSAAEMSEALMNQRFIQGVDLLPGPGTAQPRIDGDMLRFNRDTNGKWLRPIVGYFDPKQNIAKISQGGAAAAANLNKAVRTHILANNDTYIGQLTRELMQDPDFAKAWDIRGKSNDQLTNTGGGIGQAMSEILPKQHVVRDSATDLAAMRTQERVERFGRVMFQELVAKSKMQDMLTQMTTAGHGHQRAMIDQWFSLRPGWDVGDFVPVGEGKYGVALKDTAANRRRLGVEKVTNQLMPNEELGIPIVLDDFGVGVVNAFEQITNQLELGDNVLRRANGLSDLEHKNKFAPVPDTKNAFVGYLYGPDNKLVPGRTIVARSQEEYNKLYEKTLEDVGRNNGYSIRSKGHLQRVRDVYDEAGMDWIDPGISPAYANLGGQKGGLTGAYVRKGAFEEALDWVKRKSIAQAQDTLRVNMQEPIMVARMQSIAEGAVKANPTHQRNSYDVYEKLLTGKSVGFEETAILDKALRGVEKSIDGILASSAISVPARYITDLAERLAVNPLDLSGVKTYEQIAKKLGPHTPYKNVTDFLESNGVKQPPTVKAIAGKMNSLAASVYLRWLEMAHPIMNGLGLIAAMPSTIYGGRAPVSTFVDVGGKSIGLTDGLKITANAMKRMYSKDARVVADREFMLKNGDSVQSVNEFQEQLAGIKSQAGFHKWAKNIDKWVGIATDKSEAWSRQLAHHVGLEMADIHGIQGMTPRHNFAREIANSMIADYSPVNRPELFSSGFGSLIGLFQSYALNHYTKMFRWMEDGNYKAFGIQAAMQATMFGVPGTYGIGSLMDLRDSMTASGSEPTALDIIYSRFGSVLGGAIAHGGVSEATGLAFWTRGDMNPRIPGASGSLPAIDVGVKVANGFVDGVKSYMNAMPGEGGHAFLEAAQREMPNRVLKSWLMALNGGREVDAYGQVMTDTRDMMDYVARFMGIRSRRQQAELEAFYAGKSAMERDAAKRESLRMSFRSAVRRSNGDVNQVNPIQYYNDYVASGGNPRTFKTWVRDNLRDSDSARSVESLRNSMATPKSALEVWRYGAYGAWAVD
ncbi:structural protein [Biomphalaria pfeifferi]|uniref:Structural protein n=1 Tax=Biomphalaria pfeifferi TaxID=112525 RepID=A0AAD8ANG0_BIOPF|nr:structural protein [Biomphalaria pfeifferi]